LENYLDPELFDPKDPNNSVKLHQKQSMPKIREKTFQYDLYIGSGTWKKMLQAKEKNDPLPLLKITLLFGVGQDLDHLGLRFYFEKVDDRILINIPGMDKDPKFAIGISGLSSKARNIHFDQISLLVKSALANTKFKDIKYKISTLAGYSTGYRGLNQTVNEELIPLKDIETVVYYDCTYRSDRPERPKGEPPPKLTPMEKIKAKDELNDRKPDPAFNTRRALNRLLAATEGHVKIVGYMSTPKGSPKYDVVSNTNQYNVDFPIKIDLRAVGPPKKSDESFAQQSLYALFLTRALKYAQIDKQITPNVVPKSFKSMESNLPVRGSVTSSTTPMNKPGFNPTTTLENFGKGHKEDIEKMMANGKEELKKAVEIISRHQLFYPEGYPRPGNEAGILHMALLPEFGWEYLL
jgi:hypothetical protein